MSTEECALFEVSWEAANKVGGIYTVLRTKAAVTVEEYGDRYCLVGPLAGPNAALEVDAEEPGAVPCAATRLAVANMRAAGVRIVTGRWLVAGSPRVILFDVDASRGRLGAWRADLVRETGIHAPEGDGEMGGVVVFGYLVAWLLGEWLAAAGARPVVAHFHEWMGGLAAVLLRARGLGERVATVFTTHATLLGRYMCAGADVDFYGALRGVSADAEAGRRGIHHRHCVERGAAHCATVFTTVSHITAYEAEHVLGRRPDGVLPNGLAVVPRAFRKDFNAHGGHFEAHGGHFHAHGGQFNALGGQFNALGGQRDADVVPTLAGPLLLQRRSAAMGRGASRAAIRAFVEGHFCGAADAPAEDALVLFVAGRYEYRNKGVDMFLEALARLNARLRAEQPGRTVVAFVVMPAATASYNAASLRGQTLTRRLHDTVAVVAGGVASRLYSALLCGEMPDGLLKPDGLPTPDGNCLLTPDDIVVLKRMQLAVRRRASAFPPVVTHNMLDGGSDPVLAELRRLRLLNAPGDRVKVVFHAEFLSADSPVLPLEYEDFVRGCDLGVFPSYYEPWGYTPAECAVLGVPAVTSNLAGFGCYVAENVADPAAHGVFIIDRRGRSVEDSVQQLTDTLAAFCAMPQRQRDALRARTERLAECILDWRVVGREYEKARYLALARTYGRSRFPLGAVPAPCTAEPGTATPAQPSLDESIGALADAPGHARRRSVIEIIHGRDTSPPPGERVPGNRRDGSDTHTRVHAAGAPTNDQAKCPTDNPPHTPEAGAHSDAAAAIEGLQIA